MKVVILPNDERSPQENVRNATVKIGNLPVVYHVISLFERKGFSEFLILDNSNTDEIKRALLSVAHKLAGLKINILQAPSGMKSAKMLSLCQEYVLENAFFVAPNDVITDIDIEKMLSYHKQNARLATACVAEEKKYFPALSSNECEKYESKIINSGFYIFENEIFDYISEDTSLDPDVLIRIAQDDELSVFSNDNFVQRCSGEKICNKEFQNCKIQ